MSLVASNRSLNENRQLQTARCSPTFFTYCRSFSRAFCTSPMFLQICCSPTQRSTRRKPKHSDVWRADLVAHHPPVGLQPMVRSQGLFKAQIMGIWIGIYGGFFQFSLDRAAFSSRLWEMLPEEWEESGETARKSGPREILRSGPGSDATSFNANLEMLYPTKNQGRMGLGAKGMQCF